MAQMALRAGTRKGCRHACGGRGGQVMRSSVHVIYLAPAHRIDLKKGRSSGHEAAIMTYDAREIGESNQPIYEGARWLLKNGFAEADDCIQTVWSSTGIVSMRGR